MSYEKELWEARYQRGVAVNRWPYDQVVSFVLSNFGRGEREKISILDYGCGGGNHAKFLTSEGFDCYAIDYSPKAVELTRKLVQTVSGKEVESEKILCVEFSHLPFNDNSFDAVIDRQSLGQNMADDLPALVAEIHRVLKPGGIYFGVNFSDRHPLLQYGISLGKGDYGSFTAGPFTGLGRRHFFSRDEVQSLFTNFTIIDFRTSLIKSLLDSKNDSEEFLLTAVKPSLSVQSLEGDL